MASVTTVLQFCFVVLHCTFIYAFFNIIAMIDSVLLRIAGKPIGQIFFWAADCFMSLLINAASYPISKKQHFSTAFFLPAFIIVQWVRITLSLTLFLLAGRTISTKDVQGVLESVREMLQDVFMRGRHQNERHRRPSFSRRLLNIKTKEECGETYENHLSSAEVTDEIQKPTYSDSNTQTTVHFSPDTSYNSEKTNMEEPDDEPSECGTSSIENEEHVNGPSHDVKFIEQQHGEDNSDKQNEFEETPNEDTSDHSNKKDSRNENIHTEEHKFDGFSEQVSMENNSNENCPTGEQTSQGDSDQANKENCY